MSLEKDVNTLYAFARLYPEGWTIYDAEYEFGWKPAKHARVLRELRHRLAPEGWNVYCYRNGTGAERFRYVLTDDVEMQDGRYHTVWNNDFRTRLQSGADLTQSTANAASAQGEGTLVHRYYLMQTNQLHLQCQTFAAMMAFRSDHLGL